MKRTEKQNFHQQILQLLSFGILCCLFLCFFKPQAGFADNKRVVRVGVQDSSNFFRMEEDGTVSGYGAEYLEEIQKHTNWQYEFVEMSLQEALEAIRLGEIDLLPGCQWSKERAVFGYYSDQNMGIGSVVLCTLPENQKYFYNDFENYINIRIGVLKSAISTKQAKEYLKSYNLSETYVEYDTEKEMREAIQRGEVDALLLNYNRLEKEYKIIAKIASSSLYVLMNRNAEGLKEELNKAVNQVHMEHPYFEMELYEKYYSGILHQMALTKEEAAIVRSKKPLRVCITQEMEPVESIDVDTGQASGITKDLFEYISSITGLTFEYIPKYELETMKEMIAGGEIDLIGLVANNNQARDYLGIQVTAPYMKGYLTYAVNDEVSDYKSLDNTIVVVNTTPYFEITARNKGYQDIVFAETVEECVWMVNQGKADVSLVPEYCMDVLFNLPRIQHVQVYPDYNSEHDYCIGVSNRLDPAILSILNKAIERLPEETMMDIKIQNLSRQVTKYSIVDFFYQNNLTLFTVFAVGMGMVLAGVWIAYRNHRKLNQKLNEAIVVANRANMAKTEFLSSISHDLRTPLTALIGYSDPILNENADEKMKTENLSLIHRSGKYLLELINNLLNYTKLESGNVPLSYQAVKSDTFFSQLDAVIRPLAEKKRIRFEMINKDTAHSVLYIDELRVKQVCTNLLNNAIKFNLVDGYVFFSLDFLEEMSVYQIVVRDNGIGIGEEFLPVMFEKFNQENRVRQEGVGMGLAVVKHLVDEMNGTIQVNSKRGEGTEFQVELPVDINRLSEEEEKSSHSLRVSKEERTEDSERENLKGLRVLLCEDHPINCAMEKRILEKFGIQVEVATDGQMAVELFQNSTGHPFDLILMDIRMPVLDGLQATKEIRRLEEGGDTRVMIYAMTANNTGEGRLETEEAGMDGYLTKPITGEQLYLLLTKICKKDTNVRF